MSQSNQDFKLIYRGVTIDAASLRFLEACQAKSPHLTRSDLARLLCQRLEIKRANGTLAIDSCRLFLGRLEKRGVLTLPPAQHRNHYQPQLIEAEALYRAQQEQPVIKSMCGCVFGLRLLKTADERQRMRALLSAHHYLGNPALVGERLCYVATLNDTWVALCIWAGAALKNGPRDQLLGWNESHKAAQLHLVVNNVRFLILPHVQVLHLASRVLSANLRVLRSDWQSRYGHDVLLAETFVDGARFKGTCYRAANWRFIGQTRGYARKQQGYQHHGQKKDVYIYELKRKACTVLSAPLESPDKKELQTMTTLNVEKLPQGIHSLSGRLRALVDPRKARGKRHSLGAIYRVCITATLCGVKSFEAIEQWARAQSKEVLEKLGCRKGRPPSERTIRRMLQQTGQSLDEVIGEWQAQWVPLKDQAVAIDGKTLRGSHGGEQVPKHLISVVTHNDGYVLAQKEVSDKTNEITVAIPVLNRVEIKGAVVTGDAMHTQRELAQYVVEERQADYVFTVKDNQPTLKQDIERLDWAALPPCAPNH